MKMEENEEDASHHFLVHSYYHPTTDVAEEMCERCSS